MVGEFRCFTYLGADLFAEKCKFGEQKRMQSAEYMLDWAMSIYDVLDEQTEMSELQLLCAQRIFIYIFTTYKLR